MTVARRLPMPGARRLDADDWVGIGLRVLGESGIDAVRVESLARRLKISKGSFYWHFKARPELLRAMLQSWRRNATTSIIEKQQRAEVNALQRLRLLIDLPVRSRGTKNGAALELAIRLWAKSDVQAAYAIEEVDEVRLTYIRGLLEEAAAPPAPPDKIEAHAYLTYAFMLAEAFVSANLSTQAKAVCDRILGINAIGSQGKARIAALR